MTLNVLLGARRQSGAGVTLSLVYTGEKGRKRSPETRDQLTPRERQIARLGRKRCCRSWRSARSLTIWRYCLGLSNRASALTIASTDPKCRLHPQVHARQMTAPGFFGHTLAVTALPETRYAKSAGVNIAYQILGDGPIDMVHIPPWISNLDLQWDDPPQARYFRRLASFSRLIMLDKRGTGLSDRVAVATLEERMDDVRAVMDAAGSQRAVIFGSSEGGALAILFSVTYPQRVSALVLYGAYPRGALALGYPDGIPMEIVESAAAQIESQWGQVGAKLLNQMRFALNRAQGADPRIWRRRRALSGCRQARAPPPR
jgi:hypothetical protein